MNKIFFSLIVVAALTVSACASPTGVSPTQLSSSDQVATIVAATVQALTSEAADSPTSVPEASTSLLPRSLYFLGKDSQAITQVYRIERDGKTAAQLTFEPVNVAHFDVSLADGSIAYVVDNQLLLANADGSNRRVLVDGVSVILLPAALISIALTMVGMIVLSRPAVIQRQASRKHWTIALGTVGAALCGLYTLEQRHILADQFMQAVFGEGWAFADDLSFFVAPALAVCLVPLAVIAGAALGILLVRLAARIFPA